MRKSLRRHRQPLLSGPSVTLVGRIGGAVASILTTLLACSHEIAIAATCCASSLSVLAGAWDFSTVVAPKNERLDSFSSIRTAVAPPCKLGRVIAALELRCY